MGSRNGAACERRLVECGCTLSAFSFTDHRKDEQLEKRNQNAPRHRRSILHF